MGAFILAIIILFILCCVLFKRVRSETNRTVHKSNSTTSSRKQIKLENTE